MQGLSRFGLTVLLLNHYLQMPTSRYFVFCAYVISKLAPFSVSTRKSDPDDSEKVLDKTRKLGLVVVRGTQVSLVSPEDGLEPIANPFVAQE